MAAKWYIVKYVPDLFRNEPRNVGVLVTLGNHGVSKFIGEQSGKIDGKRVRGVVSSVDVYKAWVEYVEHHLASGTLEGQIDRLTRRVFDNYQIESRGTLLDDINPENLGEVAQALFNETVKVVQDEAVPTIDQLTSELFARLAFPAHHALEQDIKYEIELKGGARRELQFDYRYRNGKTTLLDKISLADREKNVTVRVNDLLFRVEHAAREPHFIQTFVALYDCGAHDRLDKVEHHLRALEKYAATINVRDSDATNELSAQLGVPLAI